MKKSRQLSLLVAVCGFSAVLLRLIGALLFYDGAGFFAGNTPLLRVSGWLVFAAVVLTLLAFLPRRQEGRVLLSVTSPLFYIPTALTALCTIPQFLHLFRAVGAAENTAARVCAVLSLLFLLLGIAHLVLLTVYELPAAGHWRAYLAFALPLYFCAYTAFLYFDSALPLSSSCKVADQLAMLACAIYLLSEIRLCLGRGKRPLCLCCGVIAAVLCAYSAFPALVVYFVQGKAMSHAVSESILTAAMAILAFCRVLHLAGLPTDRVSPLVSALCGKKPAAPAPGETTTETNNDKGNA